MQGGERFTNLGLGVGIVKGRSRDSGWCFDDRVFAVGNAVLKA
jgi:hypothetical protein